MNGSDDFSWVRSVRLMIMEAYTAPFWPKIEYDAGRLVEVMDRVGADTVRFGTIGWGSLFPTEHMPQLEGLGGRDLVRETVDACGAAGKRVFAYVPVSHPLPRRIARAHPGWNQRDINGKANGYSFFGAPGHETVYPTCSHGPYRQAIHKLVEQIVRDYPEIGRASCRERV